jgi:hypothetical protein
MNNLKICLAVFCAALPIPVKEFGNSMLDFKN